MRKGRLLLFLGIILALFSGVIGWWLFHDLPQLDDLPEQLNTPSVRITDRYGNLLYEILSQEGGRHIVVPMESIPLALKQATIATEDRNFYSNPGVDIGGVLRALWINLHGEGSLAGGSTITQQVARNLLLNTDERFERSLRRKIREAFLALELTRRFDKDQILALYLNQSYYGGMAYGVEAAAQTYFGKPVSELDLAECALLAGLPQAPALYNPFTDPEAAQERQTVVLSLMETAGYISAEQRTLAKQERLMFSEEPYPVKAPHFVMMVRQQLDELFTPEDIYVSGGLIVRTSLDLSWQAHAERAVTRQLETLKHSEDGLGHNVNNAALVALDPNSGEILALVGSPDYFDDQTGGAINMALSPRQPGSALKPLVYAEALDPQRTGGPWTAATMMLDVRTSFLTHDGKAYTPENYDQREHGPVLVREALASSLNIPAVLTLDHIGLQSLFNLGEKLGITTLGDPQSYDLSLALGGGEIRLLELTAAYGAFANGGFRVPPVAILEVRDLQEKLLYAPSPLPKTRVMDERVSWLISDILSDNDARKLGFGTNSALRLDRPAAVKTGTTSNFHDNWTVGYTPELVVGVWAGNTDYQPMRGVDGLTGAAPIWHQFLRTVLVGKPPAEFTRPAGLEEIEVCAISGLLPTQACPYRRWEWFIQGTQPTKLDTYYREVVIDSSTGLLADARSLAENRYQRIVVDLPPQAARWAREQGLLLYNDLVPAASSAGVMPIAALSIISPPQGSIYRLAAGFTPGAQRILLEAVCNTSIRELTIWLDGEVLARFSGGPYQTWWALQSGDHQVWAEVLRENGESLVSAVISFSVIESP